MFSARRAIRDWAMETALSRRADFRGEGVDCRELHAPGQRLQFFRLGGELFGGSGLRDAVDLERTLFLISSLYYRRAAGDRAGLKERTSWALPIDVGPLALSFDGSVDVITKTSSGTDVSAMPALVADVGRLVGLPRETVALGSEWFLHRARGARLVAPQMVVRWVF